MNPRYRGLYNKGNAELRSMIKRYNQRIVSVAKRFGTDSQIYRDMIAPLSTEKYSDLLGTSKSGYLKLDVNLNKDRNKPELYDLLLTCAGSINTIGQITRRARMRLEERGEKATQAAITEEAERAAYYESEMGKVKEFIYNNYTISEAREIYPELYRGQNGSRIDYDILDDIISREKEQRDNWFKGR